MARKEKTIHYLYKTTCLITNKYYIGMHSTYNLEDGYMGSGRRLRRSIRKYGVENHTKEILKFFENRDLLVEAEKKVITLDMITDNNCMNLMSGGTGGFVSLSACTKGGKVSGGIHKTKLENDLLLLEQCKKNFEIIKQKARELGKYKYGNFLNKRHSEETKKKMSESSKGMGIGETNSQYGTCWITKDGSNKKIKKEDLDTYLNEGWVKGRK